MNTSKTIRITPWYRQVKFWHLLLYGGLLIGIIATGFMEYRSRYRDTLSLFQDYSHATVTAIAFSGSNQARLSEKLEQSYLNRALGLLKTVDQLEAEDLLTPQRLAALQREHDIFQVIRLDSDGLPLDRFRPDHRRGPPIGIQRQVEPLLSGQVDTLIAGMPGGGPPWLGPPGGNANFIVGIQRSLGGAIICLLTIDAESALRTHLDLENLLLEMLDIEGVNYIHLELPGYEPLIVSTSIPHKKLLAGQRQLLQENLYLVNAGDQVFVEVNDYVVKGGELGTIQVGFSTDLIDELKASVISQILIRSGLFTIIVVIAFFFIISRQNTILLRTEKNRIERDVIRLEQINRIQEKQAAIGTLAAGLAHEIRNPLNAIGIIAQRLKREFKSTDQSTTVEAMSTTMVSEINRLNQILEDFLNYSRPTPLKFIAFDFNDILNDLALLFKDQARANEIDFTIQNYDIIRLEGDPEYLKQALHNIVRNGLEATAPGGKVSFSIADTKPEIIIRIKDTGIGIEPQKLNRIFDIFYTTKEDGNGIGLAVTHKIISDHNGTIEVLSEPGQGTEFVITLPKKHP